MWLVGSDYRHGSLFHRKTNASEVTFLFVKSPLFVLLSTVNMILLLREKYVI